MKNQWTPAAGVTLGGLQLPAKRWGSVQVIEFRPLHITGDNRPHLSGLIPGAVTEVKTDIYVTSFGPVSDVEMVSEL